MVHGHGTNDASQRLAKMWSRMRAIFPLTWLGFILASGSVLAFYDYGFNRLDLVLLSLGLLGLAIISLSLITTLLGVWQVRNELRSLPSRNDPLRAECGFDTETGFSLRARWYLPLQVVSWTWDGFSPDDLLVEAEKKRARYHERVRSRSRRSGSTISRRVTVGDLFGFTSVELVHVEVRELRFMPTTGMLRGVQVVRSLAGGDALSHPDAPAEGERVDMRQYAHGDPIRFVLWKVYARSRELVVRTPERALSPSEQTVAYLVCGPGDEPAAAAARLAVSQGALGGDWRFGVDGDAQVFRKVEDAIDAIARSGGIDPKLGGSGLRAFIKDAVPAGARRAVIFAPSKLGPWLEHIEQGALAGVHARFVLCTDGVSRKDDKKSPKRNWLRDPPPRRAAPWATPMPSEADVQAVIDKLAATGSEVLWLDRTTGGIYGKMHQRQILGTTHARRTPQDQFSFPGTPQKGSARAGGRSA